MGVLEASPSDREGRLYLNQILSMLCLKLINGYWFYSISRVKYQMPIGPGPSWSRFPVLVTHFSSHTALPLGCAPAAVPAWAASALILWWPVFSHLADPSWNIASSERLAQPHHRKCLPISSTCRAKSHIYYLSAVWSIHLLIYLGPAAISQGPS